MVRVRVRVRGLGLANHADEPQLFAEAVLDLAQHEQACAHTVSTMIEGVGGTGVWETRADLAAPLSVLSLMCPSHMVVRLPR